MGYGNSYEAASGMGTGAEALLIVFVLLFYLLIWGFALVSYVLSSLAYYKIAKRRGIKNPWLSWIPVGNSWIMGKVASDYDERNGHKRAWHKALLALVIIGFAIMAAFYVMFIVSIITMSLSGYYLDGGAMGMFWFSYMGIIVAAVVLSAYSMLSAICVYKTFESTLPEKALKYIILYFLVPLAGPICLVKCMDKGYEYTEDVALTDQPFSVPDEKAIEPAAEVTEEVTNTEETETIEE